MKRKILITDTTSYLNSYICLYGLELGMEIKAGLSENLIESHLTQIQNIHRNYDKEIESVDLNLHDEKSIRAALEGCDTVIHSIVGDVEVVPDDPTFMIKNSINKALTLMKVCKSMKVTRLIFTGHVSSCYCGTNKKEVNDEDWGSLENTGPLQRAYLYATKTITYLNEEWERYFDLTILNVGMLMGPSIGLRPRLATNRFIRSLILGKIDQNYKVKFPIIDVRDAALIHLHVIDRQETFNKKYNTVKGNYFMTEIVEVLSDEFEQYGFILSKSEIGNFPVALLRLYDEKCKRILYGYGNDVKISNWKIKAVFTGKYRSLDETLTEMVYDLMDKGVIGIKDKGDGNKEHYDSKMFNKTVKRPTTNSNFHLENQEKIILSGRASNVRKGNLDELKEEEEDQDSDELQDLKGEDNEDNDETYRPDPDDSLIDATIDFGLRDDSGTN